MDRKIKLVNFEGETQCFLIKNFEDVITINIIVLSGDEVAEVLYKTHKIIKFDSDIYGRINGYYNGSYFILPEELGRFNRLKGSSYDRAYKWRMRKDK